MQKQDFFSKQQNKSGFSGGVIRQPQQKSNSLRIWLVVILILALGVGGYFYKHQLFNQAIPLPPATSGYSIGSSIQREGILTSDGDLMTYTHTLNTKEGEKLLLKSSTVPLNNYSNALSGVFQIVGTIESIYQGLPLIEVSTIGTQTTSENPLGTGTEPPQEQTLPWVYLAKAGLGFPADFFENYAFVGEAGTKSEIVIKNLDNEKITKISFFTCSHQGDSNCKELTRTFNDTAPKKITTLNGDTFYRLPEVKSRYFQNGNWWGYFINDADDEEVEKIKNLIIIANADLINDAVSRYGVKTCLGTDNGTTTIRSHTPTKTTEGLKVTLEGAGEKTFSCEVMVDLTQATKLKFVDVKVKESPQIQTWTVQAQTGASTEPKKTEEPTKDPLKEDQAKAEATTSGTPVTPSTKQFPINPEKTMTYNSSRGEYAMTFPSSNISYTSDSADESFDQLGVRCSYATKVIEYKNKDAIQNSPTVIVYECKFKNGFELPWENYFLKELGEKKFVVAVLDAAWFDFAKNISITSF